MTDIKKDDVIELDVTDLNNLGNGVGRYPAPGGAFPAPKAPTDWIRGHAHSMYSFLNSVYSEKEPTPNFDDGAHVQAVMEAAYASAKSGACENV